MRDHEFFPGAMEWIERVRVLERDRDVRRMRRLINTYDYSPHDFTLRVNDVYDRMMDNARKPPEERGGAFAVLSDNDLGIIERQLEYDERVGRLKIVDAQRTPHAHLALLRANLLSGKMLVDGPMFRQIARGIYEELLDDVIALTGDGTTERPRPVTVVPWRAGLIGAEVFQRHGVQWFFWHLGMKRNERTLEAETYFESAPPSTLRDREHLICDPMLATGNTNAAIINRIVEEGVPTERIINFALIAAPEGIFRLLREFPGLRVMTLALDGQLNERGYITDPGLGDFGDFALNDVDMTYAEEHWLQTGLLTRPMVDTILGRTREVKEALTAHSNAPA